MPAIARYGTVDIAAVSKVMAEDCRAMVQVLSGSLQGRLVLLHWAGEPITPQRSTAQGINIMPDILARLDVAFTVPPPNTPKPEVSFQTSGQITRVIGMGLPDRQWQGEGCWLAQPEALYNPQISSEVYLSPGDYPIRILIRYSRRLEVSMEFILVSPNSWEGLQLAPT